MDRLKIISRLVKGTSTYNRFIFSPPIDREEQVNRQIQDIGYVIDADLTTNEIGVFYSKAKNNYQIIHKGTQFIGRTMPMDIQSDFDLVMSGIGAKKQFIKRRDDTTKIIKNIKSKNPSSSIDLGGESLGGATSSFAFSYLEDEEGRYLHKNIDSLTTLNPAFPPKFITPKKIDDMYLDLYKHIDSDVREKIEKKPIVHHRIRSDIVSKGLEQNIPFGNVETYELDENKGYLHSHSVERFIEMSPVEERGEINQQIIQEKNITPNINIDYNVNLKTLCNTYGSRFSERCNLYYNY